MQASPIRIGTRGSPLALAQANEVRSRLAAAHGLDADRIEIRVIRTMGDRVLDRPLSEIGGKGLFTKEIEEALIRGEIDLAVHSMKDMATALPDGLEIGAILPREDARDAYISLGHRRFEDLPQGAIVGTSSLRRQAQVKRRRPDIEVVSFRGNVETRLRKLGEGIADATFLAVAGLNRLGLADRITAVMAPDDMLPAVAQGVIAVEIRAGDETMAKIIAPLDHHPTAICATAERAFLARLEGSCRTPIAGLAQIGDNVLRLRGMILTPDGGEVHETALAGRPETAPDLGLAAADSLLARAGPGFFRLLA